MKNIRSEARGGCTHFHRDRPPEPWRLNKTHLDPLLDLEEVRCSAVALVSRAGVLAPRGPFVDPSPPARLTVRVNSDAVLRECSGEDV